MIVSDYPPQKEMMLRVVRICHFTCTTYVLIYTTYDAFQRVGRKKVVSNGYTVVDCQNIVRGERHHFSTQVKTVIEKERTLTSDHQELM
jgi:hypothetical protein